MEDAISLVTSIHLFGYTVAIARKFALDKCNLNQTKICVLLKISKFAYLFESIFLYEPLRMKIDHLSTTLGVENDVESHCNIKYLIVPANFVNVIMPRRHAQNGVIDDLHSTTVYFRVFSNFSVKW